MGRGTAAPQDWPDTAPHPEHHLLAGIFRATATTQSIGWAIMQSLQLAL